MTRICTVTLGLFTLLLSLPFAPLCMADDVLQNGKFDQDIKYWGTNNSFGDKPTVVDVTDLKGNTKAIKFDIKNADPKKSYQASLRQTLHGYIPKGTKITLKFKAKGTTDKIIEAMVQFSGKPYTSVVMSGKLTLNDSWQTYSYTGITKEHYAPGALRAYFRMGHNDGSVQITDVTVDMPDSGLPPVGEPLNFNHVFTVYQAGWSLPSTKLNHYRPKPVG